VFFDAGESDDQEEPNLVEEPEENKGERLIDNSTLANSDVVSIAMSSALQPKHVNMEHMVIKKGQNRF
jgi:hypothetical protein